MASEKFNFIINNFKPKDHKQLSDLKVLFNKHPYSQTISAYYLKSIKDQNKNNFSHMLRKTAILSFDRSNLRNWISSDISQGKQSSKDNTGEQIEDRFTFLDWFDQISNNKSKIDEKISLIESFIDNKSERIIKNNDKEYKLLDKPIVSKYISDFTFSKDQIYRRNKVDQNCERHKKVFKQINSIPKLCFGCFKEVIELESLFDKIFRIKISFLSLPHFQYEI